MAGQREMKEAGRQRGDLTLPEMMFGGECITGRAARRASKSIERKARSAEKAKAARTVQRNAKRGRS